MVLVDPESWFTENGAASARSTAPVRRHVAWSVAIDPWSWDLHEVLEEGRTRRRLAADLAAGHGTLGVILEPQYARHLGPTAEDISRTVRAAVVWSRTDDIITVESEELPSWVAAVDGLDVARTGEEFGRLVRRLSYGDRVPSLSGGRVEGMETLVDDPSVTVRVGTVSGSGRASQRSGVVRVGVSVMSGLDQAYDTRELRASAPVGGPSRRSRGRASDRASVVALRDGRPLPRRGRLTRRSRCRSRRTSRTTSRPRQVATRPTTSSTRRCRMSRVRYPRSMGITIALEHTPDASLEVLGRLPPGTKRPATSEWRAVDIPRKADPGPGPSGSTRAARCRRRPRARRPLP